MIAHSSREHDIILAALAPLDPSDHKAALERLLIAAAAGLVVVAGDRAAYEAVQRISDAIPGVRP